MTFYWMFMKSQDGGGRRDRLTVTMPDPSSGACIWGRSAANNVRQNDANTRTKTLSAEGKHKKLHNSGRPNVRKVGKDLATTEQLQFEVQTTRNTSACMVHMVLDNMCPTLPSELSKQKHYRNFRLKRGTRISEGNSTGLATFLNEQNQRYYPLNLSYARKPPRQASLLDKGPLASIFRSHCPETEFTIYKQSI